MTTIEKAPGIISNLSEYSLSKICPEMRPSVQELGDYAESMGYKIKIISVHRTFQEQTKLWNTYRSGKSSHPVSRPGTSSHEGRDVDYAYSLAIDINIVDEEGNIFDVTNQIYNQYGRFWESFLTFSLNGNEFFPRWGKKISPVHFEYRKLIAANLDMKYGPSAFNGDIQ